MAKSRKRRRRRRIQDAIRLPRVDAVIPSDWRERHGSRLERANAEHAESEAAFLEIGGALFVKNGGHHWMILFKTDVVEWWPSSAKLVVNKKWRNGVHAHTWLQVRDYLCDVVCPK